MADLSSLLAVLEHDPDDAQALEALALAARQTPPDVRASRFAAARRALASRGRPDAVVQLIDIELATTGDVDRKVDLLLEKGMVLDGELLDVAGRARRVRRGARAAHERRDGEARRSTSSTSPRRTGRSSPRSTSRRRRASTDRSLATGLYVSAAEAYVRFAPDAPEAEAVPAQGARDRSARTARPRSTSRGCCAARERWQDLGELLDERAEQAPRRRGARSPR